MRSVLFVAIFVLSARLAVGAATPPPNASSAPHASPSPATSSAAGANSAPPASLMKRLAAMAPADAYFGPFGMSPLSIRSTIGLLGRQYHYRTISDHDLLRKALITEDALRKWRAKYPADPWLPPTFFHLEQLYQAVQTDEARKHATAILKDVIANYPSTKEGHLSRSRLSAGFPPLVAESPVVPATAAPGTSADASPSAGAMPPPDGSSSSQANPTASPGPSGATASASPGLPGPNASASPGLPSAAATAPSTAATASPARSPGSTASPTPK